MKAHAGDQWKVRTLVCNVPGNCKGGLERVEVLREVCASAADKTRRDETRRDETRRDAVKRILRCYSMAVVPILLTGLVSIFCFFLFPRMKQFPDAPSIQEQSLTVLREMQKKKVSSICASRNGRNAVPTA